MAYTTHDFQSGQTLYASQLNEMDAQIALNAQNIENGGNNSSIEMTLVKEIVTTEEVSNITIKQTSDGSALAIKSLFMDIYVPVAASAYMIFCYMNGDACFAAHDASSTTEECRTVAFANTLSGYQRITDGYAFPISAFGGNKSFVKYGRWLMTEKADAITDISLDANASGAVFPIGTTVKIYEVNGHV